MTTHRLYRGGGVPLYDHGVLYPLTGYIGGGGVPVYDHGVLYPLTGYIEGGGGTSL